MANLRGFFVAGLLSILCFSNFLIAQNSTSNIFGTVIDAKTGLPLEGANVFLANTMMGDATDAEGNFMIKNVPTGPFDLVASMIGYAGQTQHIRVRLPMGKIFLFKLEPRVLPGETIVANAADQKA